MDDRLSPAEKMQVQAELGQRLNSIQPMMVPPDQQPVDPMQQYTQETLTVPDSNTGLNLRYRRHLRNGVQEWQLDEASKVELDLWRDKKLAQYEQDIGVRANKIKEAQYDAAIKALEARRPEMPKRSDFMKWDKDDNRVLDTEAYNKELKRFHTELDDWTSLHNDLSDKFYRDAAGQQNINGQPQPIPPHYGPPATPQPIPPHVGPPPEPTPLSNGSADQPPQWYLDLPSGAEYTAPDGSRRIKP
jgi:hypothetical protein